MTVQHGVPNLLGTPDSEAAKGLTGLPQLQKERKVQAFVRQ